MTALKSFLSSQHYTRVKLKLTKTNHFELKAAINGVEGRFILDTGASNTCIGLDKADVFGLHYEVSEIKAAGAGATEMETCISKNNNVTLGNWKKKRQKIVLFNLVHVNQALVQHNSHPVDGIIGADLLKKGKAIIDYNRKALYLLN
ncbi:MAG: TIGR02281 family clan AA aspartic protease [Croceivirga sp.]